MTLEFQCEAGHVTEKFFRSISAGEQVDTIQCEECGAEAKKIFSAPLGFGFYGNPDGYYKPSALKRSSTKLVSGKDGNKNAIG